MRFSVRAMLWGLVALAASVGPALLGRRGQAALDLLGAATSRLAFERRVVDFGTVFVGEKVVSEFAFRNTADVPVRITEATASCGCLEVVPSTRYLEPGQAGILRATFVSDGRHGPQTLRISVRTDEGGRGGVALTMVGEVRAVFRPRPPRVFLTDLRPGARRVLEFSVDALEPFEDLRLETQGRELTARIAARGADGFTVRAELSIEPRSGGRFDGIALRYTAAGRALVTWIPVVFSVPPPLVVEPAELELKDGKGALTVRARWPDAVALAAVDVGGLPLKVTRSPLGEGGTRLEVVNTGEAWEIPADAVLRLRAAPASFGVVEVSVYVAGP